MLKFEYEQPVIIDRHIGYLDILEATHHYCTAGTAPDGTILATYGLHPDIPRPSDLYVPVDVAGAKYPVYRFRPREAHADYRWPSECCYCWSADSGRTWSDPTPDISCGGATAVGDKTLCPNGFVFLVEPGLGVTYMSESDDNGRTWSVRPDVFFHYPPEFELCINSGEWIAGTSIIGHFENHATFKTLADGSVVTFVTVWKDCLSEGGRLVRWIFPLMFRSTDGGYNFEFVGLPTGMPPHAENEALRGVIAFVEPAMTQLPNGDLLAVFRTGYHRPDLAMLQCKSSDGGATWSELILCPGVLRHYPVRRLHPLVNEGKTHTSNAGVSAWLATLPNGVVAMVYGRPGEHITFSEDGSGEVWTDRLPIVPEPSLFGINCDSSHMAGLVAVSSNQLVIMYDVANYQPPDGGPLGNTVFSFRMTVDRA